MIRIAIIDDGVNSEKYNLLPIQENIIIHENGKINRNVPLNIINSMNSQHGSICAAIISKYCKDAELINIVLTADITNEKIHPKLLYWALELCLVLQVDLVNISAGIIDISYYYDFLGIVNTLYKKGTIMVAAISSDEKLTIPACYSNVVGVLYSDTIKKGSWVFNDTLACRAQYLVNNTEFIRLCNGELQCVGGYSSFSTPIICSEIANSISRVNQQVINHFLYAKVELAFDWLESPVIYVLSKELPYIDETRIVFENYILDVIYCENFIEGIDIIKGKIQCSYHLRDIAIFTNQIFTEKYIIDNPIFVQHNIAVFVENISLSNALQGTMNSRVFLLSESLNKSLSKQYKFEAEIEIVHCLNEEECLRIFENSMEDTLVFSTNSIHMLYGAEFIPTYITSDNELLSLYVSRLVYVYNLSKAVVILQTS